jgi:UDPglucose--hexose-1-phosphate uridylyltransferase
MASINLDLQSDVHRRLNPLTGEWVLVSPHRSVRPWHGQTEAQAATPKLAYDPACYLCPGNHRAEGAVNPQYESTFVFDNDFPALRPHGPAAWAGAGTLLQAQGEAGRCRVICYSPLHDVTLGQMPLAGIRQVIDTWAEQTLSLGRETFVNAVTIFENRGAMMGASNPHPHGQIWTNDSLPNEMARESSHQAGYLHEHGTCLLCDYTALELDRDERIVCANDEFVALVPFWAVWPFETLLVPRRHAGSLDGLDARGRNGFAHILRELTRRYDSLFGIVFPYTMGLHQRPTDGQAHAGWHLHAHFYPPLLRSATVRKFMVGYEMLAGPQRDITPENAAARLRTILLQEPAA